MNEILQTNIFFIITSIGVIIITIITSLILFHVLKVVKAVRRIVERVERGSEALSDDIEELRQNLNPSRLIAFVVSCIPGIGKK